MRWRVCSESSPARTGCEGMPVRSTTSRNNATNLHEGWQLTVPPRDAGRPADRRLVSIMADDPFDSTASGKPARARSATASTAPDLAGSSRKARRATSRALRSGSTPNSAQATSSASRVTISKSAHRSIDVRSQEASSCLARQRAASGSPRPGAKGSHARSSGARSTSVPYRSKHTTPTRRGLPSVKPVFRLRDPRSPPAAR